MQTCRSICLTHIQRCKEHPGTLSHELLCASVSACHFQAKSKRRSYRHQDGWSTPPQPVKCLISKVVPGEARGTTTSVCFNAVVTSGRCTTYALSKVPPERLNVGWNTKLLPTSPLPSFRHKASHSLSRRVQTFFLPFPMLYDDVWWALKGHNQHIK